MRMLFPLLGLLIVFAWGCGKSEKKEETEKASTTVKEVTKSNKKIVARVNGRPVYEEDVMIRHIKEVVSVEDKNLAEEIHQKALERQDLEKIALDYTNSGKKATVRDSGFRKNYNDIF